MFKREVDNRKIFKKAIKLSTVIFLVGLVVFVSFEPSIVESADNKQITVSTTVTAEFSVTSPDSTLALSPSIPGITGNAGSPATGTETFTVITNNSTGFIMKIKASSVTPAALVHTTDNTYYFSDHTTTASYDWTAPGAAAASFGYTINPATAADKAQAFKDNGAACGGAYTGNTTDKCWSGLTASDVTVISRATPTSAAGEAEAVKFNAESNAKFLRSGSYTATITVTAATP
jgi:hypothetical protein